MPDTLTLNEKKRPTVALALDGMMKWGATAGILANLREVLSEDAA